MPELCKFFFRALAGKCQQFIYCRPLFCPSLKKPSFQCIAPGVFARSADIKEDCSTASDFSAVHSPTLVQHPQVPLLLAVCNRQGLHVLQYTISCGSKDIFSCLLEPKLGSGYPGDSEWRRVRVLMRTSITFQGEIQVQSSQGLLARRGCSLLPKGKKTGSACLH